MFGPSFDYSQLVPLLGQREELSGPIWVAWDTNVLSYYETYGLAMWENDLPEVITGADPDEVEALGALISVWMWWDLRFMVMDATESDSRRPRSVDDLARRRRAISGLAEALSLGLDGWQDWPEQRRALPDTVALRLPKGQDRELVKEAQVLGADVFLTTDRKVLRCDAQVRPHGLRCMSPTGLLDDLIRAGVQPNWAPSQMGGLAPDLGRMSALIAALDQDGGH
jgi:hypothetical protein